MAETDSKDFHRRLTMLSPAERADVLSAVRTGTAVWQVANAQMALDVARWQIRHSGMGFVRQPEYCALLLVFAVAGFFAWGPLAALVVPFGLALGAIIITTFLRGRAQRSLEANLRLLNGE